METLIDILIVCVLLSVCTLPIILTVLFVMLRKMYNDWKRYILGPNSIKRIGGDKDLKTEDHSYDE